jgi:broad specificity phosphatase PhoE
MKIIEIRRHGKTDKKKNLTCEGYVHARAIGERDMQGEDFDCVFVSHLSRTADTARAFAEGAGDFIVEEFIQIKGLHTPRSEDWGDLFCLAESKEGGEKDIAHLRDLRPAFVHNEAERLQDVFHEIVRQIPDGGRALIVGHSPIIECLVYAVTGELIKPLQECEGLILTIYIKGNITMEEIRL